MLACWCIAFVLGYDRVQIKVFFALEIVVFVKNIVYEQYKNFFN